jgi:EAL domain-containing protein (putative c-di-GMP-specific phosphodiesterase class I)/PAS domain-containing protein
MTRPAPSPVLPPRCADVRALAGQEALEALFATVPVGLGLVDRRLRWVRVNEALASITVLPRVLPLCGHALDTGQPIVNQEILEPGPAGATQTWLASCYPVGVDAENIGIGVVLVDVTDKRREADEFRSTFMASMTEGLSIDGSEGRRTFRKPAAETIPSWGEQDPSGKFIQETIQRQEADHAFTHKDGSSFPVAYSATPLVAGSASSGLTRVFHDTTERTAKQTQLRRQLDAFTWVGRTRDALDEGRLVLYSQPIVPLAGGEPGEELLLRMVGREGEIIRPATFLPAAERYGLIGEIDREVVTRAAQLAGRGRRVQANLSAVSVSSPVLLPLIEHSLCEADADPSKLVLEITETALMEDFEAGETFARGVADLGCELALDDFGTGYGSFTRLKRLPAKYLKIDIEFVRDLVSSSGSRHVVEAITGLARRFGQQTIAEGVEDRETLALLEDTGVDFAQGYHLGHPAPLAEAA